MSSGVGVELYTNVEVLSRLELLFATISNFASAFGADKACLNSIEKGVKERQIIEEIKLYYYDKDDKIQGFISLKIDWNKYELNIMDDKNKNFKVDRDKSLLEQLDQAIPEIIKHVNRMRENLGIKKVRSTFNYTPYFSTGEKYKEALNFLGHVKAKEGEFAINEKLTKSIKIILSPLNELEINIQSSR